jgi:hypothetical protein
LSNYYGDFRPGQTVRLRFNTSSAAGVPTTLSTGSVLVSKDGADATPTGGVTLTIDVGAVVGRHHVVIDTGIDAATFAAGSEYAVRLAGTSNVGGTSVVGVVVGEFSLLNRAVAPDSAGRVLLQPTTHTGAVIPTATNLTNLPPVPAGWLTATGIAAAALNGKGDWLAPTVAGRTLDVTATGEAGIDWANVGGAATTVNLSGTTISTLTTYTGNTPQTGDAFARLGAAGAGLTALGDARLAHLDADISGRPTAAAIDAQLSAAHGAGAWDAAGAGGSVTVAGYAAGQDPATLLDVRLDAIDAAVAGLPAAGAAMTLTAGERAAVAAALLDLADGVETGETLRQLCRRLRAFSAGLATTDTATGVDTFLRKDGTTTAFTVTHDADGNRTASTDGTL